MQKAPLIALLTDFGLRDPYVAQMRAMLMAAAPEVALLDVSHDVEPGNVWQAGFFLAATLPWLPPGSVVCAVVDPGVGSDRRVVLAQTDSRWIVAPDNGLLSLVFGRRAGCRLFDATPAFAPRSATFHGRDVFAPLAARLAMGEEARALAAIWTGDDPVVLPNLVPVRTEEGLVGRVLSVDRFGNVILNLDLDRFGRVPEGVALLRPTAMPLKPVRTYTDLAPDAVGILAGSQGYLELARNGASAADRCGLDVGDTVVLAWPQKEPHEDRS